MLNGKDMNNFGKLIIGLFLGEVLDFILRKEIVMSSLDIVILSFKIWFLNIISD